MVNISVENNVLAGNVVYVFAKNVQKIKGGFPSQIRNFTKSVIIAIKKSIIPKLILLSRGIGGTSIFKDITK